MSLSSLLGRIAMDASERGDSETELLASCALWLAKGFDGSPSPLAVLYHRAQTCAEDALRLRGKR